jgi:hypothetical protein
MDWTSITSLTIMPICLDFLASTQLLSCTSMSDQVSCYVQQWLTSLDDNAVHGNNTPANLQMGPCHVWFRQLVTSLSPRRPGSTPKLVHVEIVVEKVALGQVFLRVLWFSCHYHSTVVLRTQTSPGEWKTGSLLAAVWRHRLTPLIWTFRENGYSNRQICSALNPLQKVKPPREIPLERHSLPLFKSPSITLTGCHLSISGQWPSCQGK